MRMWIVEVAESVESAFDSSHSHNWTHNVLLLQLVRGPLCGPPFLVVSPAAGDIPNHHCCLSLLSLLLSLFYPPSESPASPKGNAGLQMLSLSD